ncbi:hypothetical protein HYT23_00845 [Candidatus Pacearchaeota archaeon]|nr:hypothetical protein [Candidatus Pacearchaeota archaeon]
MDKIYELKVTKKTGGIAERYYVADQGVFAVQAGRLERVTDPLNYSWNFREMGNAYLSTLTGEALIEAREMISKVK